MPTLYWVARRQFGQRPKVRASKIRRAGPGVRLAIAWCIAPKRAQSRMEPPYQSAINGMEPPGWEAENQIVVAYEVYDRRPSDSDLLLAAIETHQATLGCTPHPAI
jgi:hypothetical protein